MWNIPFCCIQAMFAALYVRLACSVRRGCGCSSGVEHNLAKVGVEGSNPFARSKNLKKMKCLPSSHKRGWGHSFPGKQGGSSWTKVKGGYRLGRPGLPRELLNEIDDSRVVGLGPAQGAHYFSLPVGRNGSIRSECRQHILVTEVLRGALKFLGGSAGFFKPEDQRRSE
jgi:hypothetical protein